MNRFLLKLFLFLSLLIVTDRLSGYLFDYLMHVQARGRYHKINYSLAHAREQIIILGSSRGENNYIPAIIAQRTGKSCWNASRAGQSIPFFLTLGKVICQRHTPEVVVLNMDPKALEGPVDFSRLGVLKPFANKYPIVTEILSSKNSMEKCKLRSNLYLYNSALYYLTLGSFPGAGEGDPNDQGWIGRYGKIDSSRFPQSVYAESSPATSQLDRQKIIMLNELIDLFASRKIKLCLVFSPDFYPYGNETLTLRYIRELQSVKSFVLLDMSATRKLNRHPQYYYDLDHMNPEGAAVYSQMIGDTLVHPSLTLHQKGIVSGGLH